MVVHNLNLNENDIQNIEQEKAYKYLGVDEG